MSSIVELGLVAIILRIILKSTENLDSRVCGFPHKIWLKSVTEGSLLFLS